MAASDIEIMKSGSQYKVRLLMAGLPLNNVGIDERGNKRIVSVKGF